MDENQIGTIIVELKLSYLLNFGEAVMEDGITRIINGQILSKHLGVSVPP